MQFYMNIGELIRRRRQELRLSQAALAKACGVSRAAVGLWESGDTAPTRAHAPAVAKALGLDLGAVSPLLGQSLVVVDTTADDSTIPLMGWDEFVTGAPVGATFPRIWVGSELPSDVVALRVPDDAMKPDFSAFDVVMVSRAETPRDGDVVVADLQGSGVLRKYVPRGRDKAGGFVFDLLSTSPDWPTITCNSDNPGNVLAVVVGHIRTFKR